MIREKYLGLVLILFINTINYYLTYSSMAPTPFFWLTYSIDTVQGWIVWYAGRAVVLKLDNWYPYSRGVLQRILLQVLLTSIVMLALIVAMTDFSTTEHYGGAYGYGLSKYDLNGEVLYGHGGFYGSLLLYHPEKQITLSINVGQANVPFDAAALVGNMLQLLKE